MVVKKVGVICEDGQDGRMVGRNVSVICEDRDGSRMVRKRLVSFVKILKAVEW